MTTRPDELLAGVCGRCHANTTFERDPQYPDILSSMCCGVGPLTLPEEDEQ